MHVNMAQVWLHDHLIRPIIGDANQPKNVWWSVKPVVIGLQLVGIDLHWRERRSAACRLFACTTCLAYFGNCMAAAPLFITAFAQELTANETTFNWNTYMVMCATLLRCPGVYLALAGATLVHGQQLVQAFQRLDKCHVLDGRVYTKIRIVSITAVILSVTIVRCNSFKLV